MSGRQRRFRQLIRPSNSMRSQSVALSANCDNTATVVSQPSNWDPAPPAGGLTRWAQPVQPDRLEQQRQCPFERNAQRDTDQWLCAADGHALSNQFQEHLRRYPCAHPRAGHGSHLQQHQRRIFDRDRFNASAPPESQDFGRQFRVQLRRHQRLGTHRSAEQRSFHDQLDFLHEPHWQRLPLPVHRADHQSCSDVFPRAAT